MTRTLAKSLYAIQAIVFLVAGISVVLVGTNLLPWQIPHVIMDIAHGNVYTLHVMQEFGSLLVFVGLITLWFLRYYEQSRAFHWAMTVFWTLFALVHWFDTQGRFHKSLEPMLETAPVIFFLIVGAMRERAGR
jgi:hypothetical protein